MVAGEAADADRDDLIGFAIAAAIDAGHDPREVREWSEGDLVRFAYYNYDT